MALNSVETAVVTQKQWQTIMELDHNWDARKLASFLEDLSIFGLLSSRHLFQLARLVQFKDWRAGSVWLLSSRHLFPLAQLVQFKDSRAGSVIYRQGSEGEDMFLVRSGYVRLVREVPVSHDTRRSLNSMTDTLGALKDRLDTLAPLKERKQKRSPWWYKPMASGSQDLLSDDEGEGDMSSPAGPLGAGLRGAGSPGRLRKSGTVKLGVRVGISTAEGDAHHFSGRPITAQDVSHAFVHPAWGPWSGDLGPPPAWWWGQGHGDPAAPSYGLRVDEGMTGHDSVSEPRGLGEQG
eukprot:gene12600-15826_t